ncbi:winged helix-turn-helix domain-containing protein [Halomicrococcus sp. NG-SE-24]|uniref:winged helix-turn-helix domain-containing protein n=1 Tax=Halomicrococcus sp. NG-SE-24 TaxID=3436928 RepID=UPI003D953ECB
MSENSEPVGTPVPSVLFSTLASPRRRHVLRQLLERDASVSLTRLARNVAASEDDVERVYAELHHRHVPKLVDAGLVTREQGGDAVTLTDGGGVVEPYLELATRLANVPEA